MFPSVLCWLSDVKDIYSIKNLCHLSPEVKFQNRWRQITERELGNPGSTMGTWCMLPARYCPLAYYIVKHIKSLRLSLFGHVARMNELTDTSRILFVQPPDNWGKPPGGHTPPGFEMFAMTCPHLQWSCQKPGRQLRANLLVVLTSTALRTYSGACSYWIAYT